MVGYGWGGEKMRRRWREGGGVSQGRAKEGMLERREKGKGGRR